MQSRSNTLLLGTAGTSTTWGILTSARDAFAPEELRLVAADMAPRHLVAGAAIADAFHRVPAVDDPAFASALQRLIAAEEITAYLPTHDSEIVLAGELSEAGDLNGIDLLSCTADSARRCWDKLLCAQTLAAAGIPAPISQRLDRASWIEGGLCIKPRCGVGSKGVEIVNDPERLSARRDSPDAELFVSERLLESPELTLDCFRARDHSFSRVLPRERIETKAGVSTKARIFEDRELEEIGNSVGEAFSLTGTYCVQVMRGDGTWQVTDVNPRSGAGTRLSAAVGVDFCGANLVDAFAGADAAAKLLPRLDEPRFVVRQYCEVVVV